MSLAAAGMFALLLHESTPAAGGDPGASWRSDFALKRDPHLPTLILFAHPHCPCTVASLRELTKIVAESGRRATVHVLFLDSETGADWTNTRSVRMARRIPGAHVEERVSASALRNFGAETSGQAALYDRSGALRFRGGITPSRGHEGVSAGHLAVVQFLLAGRIPLRSTAVFGCSLTGLT